MKGRPPCAEVLAQLRQDPLQVSEAVEAHLLRCPGCAEARVAWLAQEPTGPALTPAGYFEALPSRVLGKLPPPRPGRRPLLGWAAAAALLLGVGTSGFFLGLQRRAPVVEATLALPAHETYEILPDTPFQEAEETLAAEASLKPVPEPLSRP